MKANKYIILFFATFFFSSFNNSSYGQMGNDIGETKFAEAIEQQLNAISEESLKKEPRLAIHLIKIKMPDAAIRKQAARVGAEKYLTDIRKKAIWESGSSKIEPYIEAYDDMLNPYAAYYCASILSSRIVNASRAAPAAGERLGAVTLDSSIRSYNTELVAQYKARYTAAEKKKAEAAMSLMVSEQHLIGKH